MANIISVDLGGTNTRLALATNLENPSFNDEIVRRLNIHDYDDDLAFIIDTAKSLANGNPIDALGIGVPGRVNDEKTDMVASNNLPEWANKNFAIDLATALECPVYMDNDGVASSLGEAYYGNTKSDFHYLIWGTGISCVHVSFDQDGNVTTNYARRNHHNLFEQWENECGGAGLLRIYGKPGEQLTAEDWTKVNANFVRHLRQYIIDTKPPAIVFGGGLAVHHTETITNYADAMGVPIQITQHGGQSGLFGGLGLIRRGTVSARGADL